MVRNCKYVRLPELTFPRARLTLLQIRVKREQNVPGEILENMPEYAGPFIMRDGGQQATSPFSTILSRRETATSEKDDMLVFESGKCS